MAAATAVQWVDLMVELRVAHSADLTAVDLVDCSAVWMAAY